MLSLFEIRNHLNEGISIYELNLKVTYYARVSTDKYEQLNSLKNQINYYENFIKENTNWTFIEGYIDEGITGTSTTKRNSFKRMIKDAKNKKFNLIITKEISRFARDTLDSISYTRKLLEYGVGVLFQYDHINTFNPDSELRLTIMSSIAQEEVRKLSERVKFGLQRSIEKGKVLGNSSILGYKKENCKLVIIPEEATIIKKIYNMYVYEHLGMNLIGKKLALEGYLNKNNKPLTQTTIKYILTNPKYKGYYCGNKTKIINYHTKERININKQDWKIYQDYNNVPPIISEELWNKAQEILNKRSSKNKNKKIYQNRYPFSGKIYCMEHNCTYRRKINTSSGIKRKKIITWRCKEFLTNTKTSCNSPILYDNILKDITGQIIYKYIQNLNITDELINQYLKIEKENDYTKTIKDKENEIIKLEKNKKKLLELILNNTIEEKEFKIQINELLLKIKNLKKEIQKLNSKKELTSYIKKLNISIKELLTTKNINLDSLIQTFLERIEVYHKNTTELKIILNTGKIYSIYLNPKKHTFSINNTYD